MPFSTSSRMGKMLVPNRRNLFKTVRLAIALGAAGVCSGCASQATSSSLFSNAYVVPGDTGDRASIGYMLRRTWNEVTRDRSVQPVPERVPLHFDTLAPRAFAVTWLGHATILVRANQKWILLDPVLSNTVSPIPGIGPRRLVQSPVATHELPHIDVVLISHDHYDHLDHATVRQLAGQAGGAPQFYVGQGLKQWFKDNVGVAAEEFNWWDSKSLDELQFTFVPAQHSSGRSLASKNTTLWGGWVIASGQKRFFFSGDTSYVPELFDDIRKRIGTIDLAALPIGAYRPRALMRHEHLDPEEAVLAHIRLGATASFGVHWGTFQLGDETWQDVLEDLTNATREHKVSNFSTIPMGGVLDVPQHQ